MLHGEELHPCEPGMFSTCMVLKMTISQMYRGPLISQQRLNLILTSVGEILALENPLKLLAAFVFSFMLLLGFCEEILAAS